MARHPLQGPLDALPSYLTDATRIYDVVAARIDALTAQRRAAGGSGAGRPNAENKSLNRSVVVASVGALEAFCEDLVISARALIPGATTSNAWFAVQGSRGMVQTPNSENIAKLLWVYFRYDPRPDWNILVTTAWSEVGNGTNWRGTTMNYRGRDAAAALDAMVKVRHGFAHQDRVSRPIHTPGVVSLTPRGNLSLQSHHAFNSMSMVTQLAIQMTHGLAAHLPGTVPNLRWKKAMAGWHDLLVDTPVMSDVRARWTSHPF